MTEATSTERLAAQGRVVGDDLKELRDLVGELIGEKLEEAKSGAQEVYAGKKREAKDMEEGLAKYISEKPFKSVLIAAGAGALYGMLFLRR